MAVVDVLPALFDGYFLKVIFLLHASMSFLANIVGYSNANAIAYTAYNSIFLLSILLSILADKNPDIVLVAAAFNVVCILLDIILLIVNAYVGLFATLVIVFNLICRPITCILLLKNYSARAGVEDPTSGLLEVSVQPSSTVRPRSTYQNIDEPNQALP